MLIWGLLTLVCVCVCVPTGDTQTSHHLHQGQASELKDFAAKTGRKCYHNISISISFKSPRRGFESETYARQSPGLPHQSSKCNYSGGSASKTIFKRLIQIMCMQEEVVSCAFPTVGISRRCKQAAARSFDTSSVNSAERAPTLAQATKTLACLLAFPLPARLNTRRCDSQPDTAPFEPDCITRQRVRACRLASVPPYLLRRKASELAVLHFSRLASNGGEEQRGSGARETAPLQVTVSRQGLPTERLSGAREPGQAVRPGSVWLGSPESVGDQDSRQGT